MHLSKSSFWILILAFSILSNGQAQFVNPLHIPSTLSGTNFSLTVDESSMQFLPGDSTVTYGISADYLAPTIIFEQGDFVTLNVTNLLEDTTTMHWHGMHVAPEDDGGPHTKILPGGTWTPDFTILDEAATFWYHPHLHSKTARHVYNGAAGMIIVRDENEASLDLPRDYGVDDFPIIIQDKSFDDDNQLIFAAMADTVMINGTLGPYLEVPAQRVRFRLLNASNQRVYNIIIPPFATPRMIGSDGGLLESSIPLSNIYLAPGERIEVVADFTGFEDSTIYVRSNSSELPTGVSGGPGGASGPPGNNLDSSDFDILELRVVAANSNPAGPIPNTLNTFEIWDEDSADVTRIKVFDTLDAPFPYLINGTPFNHHVINDTVYLDDIEIWELRNETDVAHPFHIHDVQFYILDLNGATPPPSLRGRKDVVLLNVGDELRFITKFEDFTDEEIPYMYHCHNLFHEDAGMMGQFLVLEDTTTNIKELSTQSGRVAIWPNPGSGIVHVSTSIDANRLLVFNHLGQKIIEQHKLVEEEVLTLNFSENPSGVYMIQTIGESGESQVAKYIKR